MRSFNFIYMEAPLTFQKSMALLLQVCNPNEAGYPLHAQNKTAWMWAQSRWVWSRFWRRPSQIGTAISQNKRKWWKFPSSSRFTRRCFQLRPITPFLPSTSTTNFSSLSATNSNCAWRVFFSHNGVNSLAPCQRYETSGLILLMSTSFSQESASRQKEQLPQALHTDWERRIWRRLSPAEGGGRGGRSHDSEAKNRYETVSKEQACCQTAETALVPYFPFLTLVADGLSLVFGMNVGKLPSKLSHFIVVLSEPLKSWIHLTHLVKSFIRNPANASFSNKCAETFTDSDAASSRAAASHFSVLMLGRRGRK